MRSPANGYTIGRTSRHRGRESKNPSIIIEKKFLLTLTIIFSNFYIIFICLLTYWAFHNFIKILSYNFILNLVVILLLALALHRQPKSNIIVYQYQLYRDPVVVERTTVTQTGINRQWLKTCILNLKFSPK